MKNHPENSTLLPSAEDFATWAKRCIADLDMQRGQFLRDEGVPSSVNRCNNILKQPELFRLHEAHRLEAEIRQAASERGIELLPLISAIEKSDA